MLYVVLKIDSVCATMVCLILILNLRIKDEIIEIIYILHLFMRLDKRDKKMSRQNRAKRFRA